MNHEPEALAIEGVRFFGEMSASISHEIKNVLAIINENAGLLADLVRMGERGATLDLERLSRVATSINRQVIRGDDIVKGMNRFAHSADLPRESVDLAEVVAFIPELANRLIVLRGAMPRIETPAEPAAVKTNRFFLEHLVWNCLCHAMTATDGSGAVSVRVVREDGNATIRFYGLSPTALAESGEFPDARQAMVARLLDVRLHTDPSAGTIAIVFRA